MPEHVLVPGEVLAAVAVSEGSDCLPVTVSCYWEGRSLGHAWCTAGPKVVVICIHVNCFLGGWKGPHELVGKNEGHSNPNA